MSRYIDADALKQYIDDCEFCNNCRNKKNRCAFDCVLPDYLTSEWERVLDEQPTVDAVPVVRCIQTALPFEYGKVYPICGWNNGVHIIGVSEQGDPVDLVCHNYGDELWDAEKTDGIECLGARFVYCADGERKDGERRSDAERESTRD